MPFRQCADQQLVDVPFLLGREAAAFALLAPAVAHGHGIPAAGLPGLVGGDDGRGRESCVLADGFERATGDAQLHGA
ncbi:hypothetical protein D3C87_1633540 [compost metagenome]